MKLATSREIVSSANSSHCFAPLCLGEAVLDGFSQPEGWPRMFAHVSIGRKRTSLNVHFWRCPSPAKRAAKAAFADFPEIRSPQSHCSLRLSVLCSQTLISQTEGIVLLKLLFLFSNISLTSKILDNIFQSLRNPMVPRVFVLFSYVCLIDRQLCG